MPSCAVPLEISYRLSQAQSIWVFSLVQRCPFPKGIYKYIFNPYELSSLLLGVQIYLAVGLALICAADLSWAPGPMQDKVWQSLFVHKTNIAVRATVTHVNVYVCIYIYCVCVCSNLPCHHLSCW